ncbi:MAG: MMPL family transporter [Deltaproteobacteria bacterium]|nr:MMPL family transporter [Deltaproteobacteria bacterium]
MVNAKAKIEKLFESGARWFFKNPVKVLLVSFILIGFLVYQIPSITIDTSSEAMLHENDPSLLEYNRFRDQFGRAELIIIAVQAPEIFNARFLTKLQAFHADLEAEVPYLREITSLVNARHTWGQNDELIFEDLLEGWPEERDVDFEALRKQVLENPFYLNHYISEDPNVAAVIIETEASVTEPVAEEELLQGFDEDAIEDSDATAESRYFSARENREVVEAVNRVVKQYHNEDFLLTASGGPVVVDAFNRATMGDVYFCIVMSLVSVGIFLAFLFRRLSGVLIPMLVINSSLATTLGLMALLGFPIKITTTVVPAFLLAVGVCDSVHVLAIFYRQIEQGSSKEDAIAFALGHSGLPILMTSITTIAAVLSFTLAELSAIAEIGYFAAAGVGLALLYTVVMLPALLAFTPLKTSVATAKGSARMDRLLLGVARFSTSHPIQIIVLSLIVFAVFAPSIFQLKFSHNIVEYFPDSMPYRHDLSFIDHHLKGSVTLELVLDTKLENGIYDPRLLNQIENFCRQTEQIQRPDISVGKVYAITDVLKETHRALNENNPEFYRIPGNRQVIAQEFFLFENSGSDDLERIVDRQFSKTRITIKTPWVDAVICRDFIQEIEQKIRSFGFENTALHFTGLMSLMVRAIIAAIYSMARSYAIALVVITILMIFLIGDWKIGLLSMIPNLVPIFITMGLMGLSGNPLDLNSIMIGSIALGVVVDDTVHFMYNFQKYYAKTSDPYFAVRETLLGTGRALLITSLVLSTGFFILMFASLNHLIRFGFFTGIAILIALLADFLLMPAMMVVIRRNRKAPQ